MIATLAIVGMVVGAVCIAVGLVVRNIGFAILGVAYLAAEFLIYRQATDIEQLETNLQAVTQDYQLYQQEYESDCYPPEVAEWAE